MAKGDIRVNIKGLDEAMKILKSLEPETQSKIIYSAINKSLTPMIRKGKSNYDATNHPYGDKGRSAKSLSKVKLKRGVIGYRAKPKIKKGGGLVHLLDAGTKARTTSNGRKTGRIKGTRFWTKAIESERDKALISSTNNIVKVLESKINRAINKYGIKI